MREFLGDSVSLWGKKFVELCYRVPTKRLLEHLMIARIWRGTVRESDKDTYYQYLLKTGLKEYAETPGNRGVHTLRRIFDGKCEFFLLTLWDSWDAIKAFAGPDYEMAVYYPEDDKFLLDRGPKVEHYEVLES